MMPLFLIDRIFNNNSIYSERVILKDTFLVKSYKIRNLKGKRNG